MGQDVYKDFSLIGMVTDERDPTGEVGLYPALILDKDGTVVDNSCYPRPPTDEVMFDKVVDGLLYAKSKGLKFVMESNQPWVARGRMSEGEVHGIFGSVISQLGEYGIDIIGYTFCPHHPSEGDNPKHTKDCHCRKPKPQMIFELARRYNLDLRRSFVVGDRAMDIQAGQNASVRTIHVVNGNQPLEDVVADYTIGYLNDLPQIL